MMAPAAEPDWRQRVRTVPDFPVPGVRFRDLMPALWDPAARGALLGELEAAVAPWAPQWLAAPEARGFLLAAMLAERMGLGLLPVRKPGKLPPPVLSQAYALEYGQGRLEVPLGVSLAGARCVVVDDVLATGGTVLATAQLVERLGGRAVGGGFVLELAGLGGRGRLAAAGLAVTALMTVD